MQYIETIRLRTSRTEEHQLGLNFVKPMTQSIKASGLKAVRLYGNASFPYDINIILAWDTAVPFNGSAFGLGLISELQRYGLVDHCVWVEYGTEN